MEKWQEDWITLNKPSLIEHINCNVTLISHLSKLGVLTPGESSNLDAIGRSSGDITKASYLLDILTQKDGAYRHLATALRECKQTGALKTLVSGIQAHLLSGDVLFEGVKIPLKEACKSTDADRLKTMIKENWDDSLCEDILSGKSPLVAIDTIPAPLPYYVPRSLSINHQLDPEIFRKLPVDIFCIEGIELHQLTSLAKRTPNSTCDLSRNQIRRLNATFIQLECAMHFQEVSVQTPKAVHWIQYRQGTFFYVKSSTVEGFKNVQQFLTKGEQEAVAENEFIQTCLNATTDTPVLIYDSPGMGKSVLLAQLARQLKAGKPQSNVIFLPLCDLVKHFGSPDGNYTTASIRQSLVSLITKNNLGRCIVENLLESPRHRVELFLDAYDEVPEATLADVDKILDVMANDCKDIRMFITTRPDKRQKLEDMFGVIGYNIKPFDHSDKISFFLKYWENIHAAEITEQIKQFAESCVGILTASISSDENDVAGIPLQCKMLAELFANDAKSGGLAFTDEDLQITSVNKVYQKFMKKFENEDRLLWGFHTNEALRVLFSKEILKEDDMAAVDKKAVYKVGILEKSRSDPGVYTFVHRSYAEFLAGAFLARCAIVGFTPDMDAMEGFDLLFGQALTYYVDYENVYFSYGAVMNFFNFHLTEFYPVRSGVATLKDALRRSDYYDAQTLFDLIRASLQANCVDLVKFLLDLYLDLDNSGEIPASVLAFKDPLDETDDWGSNQTEKPQLLFDLRELEDLKNLVSIAAEYSSLEMVKMTCQLVETITGQPFHKFEYYNKSPIRAAVERGHFQVFEYILSCDKDKFYTEPLLYWCLENTHRDYPGVIEGKVQIIKLVSEERRDILNTSHSVYKHVPLLTLEAHLDLLKCMIEQGADPIASDEYENNIAHGAAYYSSPDEYHQLVTFLISRKANTLFKHRGLDYLTPVHRALQMIELKTETLELLAAECKVDFNDNYPPAGSELSCAISGGRSDRVINDIRRLGGKKKEMYRSKGCVIH